MWRRLHLPRPLTTAFFVAVIIALLVSFHGRSTPYNNDVLLADAIVHGHLWVDRHDTTIDSLAYNGRNWIIEGPVPALLMVPVVALFHAGNQSVEAVLLCLLAMVAAWRLLRNLGLPERKSVLLLAFLFAGTDLWWCSMLGDVWFISHTSAVAFTFLALAEAFGKKRGWLLAMWAVLAFGSRFSMVLALPLYGALLWADGNVAERRRRLVDFGGVVALGLSLWVARDVAQYGTWRDLGYTLFYQQDPWGQPTGSPFRLAYVPYEIWSYFLQAPVLAEYRQLALWPIFKVDTHGIALTWTSPALVLAFLAARGRLMAMLWATIVLIAVPSFLYYLNGWVQFGMRHALDFEPFLLVLMAMALRSRERIPLWVTALVTWSCLVGIWGVWYWDSFVRTGD
ncbi:MAG: hypothetical protein NVS3B7_02190 [Candidatus Elarobacter sp.]